MAAVDEVDIKKQLLDLYQQHGSNMAMPFWASEIERWDEFVFCLLSQCTAQEPGLVRQLVAFLQQFGLLNVEKLASADASTSEEAMVLTYSLKKYGFTDDEAQNALRVLSQAARTVQREWGGKMQRYLRRQGEAMLQELAGTFHTDTLDDAKLRFAITLWLQNVLSLPVSLEHETLLEFAKRHGATKEEVWQAAEELDMHLSLVDDLVHFDQPRDEIGESQVVAAD